MSSGQYVMLAAAFAWVLLHVVVAGSGLRWSLVKAIGENGFRGLFSLLSAAALGFLIWAYGTTRAPDHFYGLWVADPALHWLPILVMPFALLLLIAALTRDNAALAGADMVMKKDLEPVGVFRVTRHPMLWAFALWAGAHIPPNGDLGSLMLFLAILVVAIAGMFSIDRKRARQKPDMWPSYLAKSSILPFGAILSGRNSFVFAEIGWARIGIALIAWAIILMAHRTLFGVAALPG